MLVFVWLTSLGMIISSSTHVAANGIVSLFLMAELYSIEYIIYIYIFFFQRRFVQI